jgi:hypothetical protein
LGPPFLVLTHKDKLSPELFDERRAELLDAVEKLRNEMLAEEAVILQEKQRKEKLQDRKMITTIDHFSARGVKIFSLQDIFEFGKNLDEVDNILSLLDALILRCNRHSTKIPFIWEKIARFIDDQLEPFIRVEDILKSFPTQGPLIVIRYMHNEGRLMWFENESMLSDVVFHNISEITKVILTLFDHRRGEMWDKRVATFRPFYFDRRRVTAEKYSKLVDTFKGCGVLDERLLTGLFESLSFPEDRAICLLKTFYLLCGPIQRNHGKEYIIPYLSPDLIVLRSPSAGLLRIKMAVRFDSLPPPSYVYHLLVVSFLNLFTDHRYQIKAAKNGSSVTHGQNVTTLLHNHIRHEILLYTDTPVEQLDAAWKRVFEVLETILNKLKSVWVAAHPVCTFYCAHCLRSEELEPYVVRDPDWYRPPEDPETDQPFSQRLDNFTGIDPVPCGNDSSEGGPPTVPSPLRYPCE